MHEQLPTEGRPAIVACGERQPGCTRSAGLETSDHEPTRICAEFAGMVG